VKTLPKRSTWSRWCPSEVRACPLVAHRAEALRAASREVTVLLRVSSRWPYRLFGSPNPLRRCSRSPLGPSSQRPPHIPRRIVVRPLSSFGPSSETPMDAACRRRPVWRVSTLSEPALSSASLELLRPFSVCRPRESAGSPRRPDSTPERHPPSASLRLLRV
jgi:hypothetical protein